MNKYSKKIGQLFGIGDFEEWLSSFTDKAPEAFFYKNSQVNTEVTIGLPLSYKRTDTNGDYYFVNYTPEEMKVNITDFDFLLNQEEILVSYKGKFLSEREIKKVKTLLEVLLEN